MNSIISLMRIKFSSISANFEAINIETEPSLTQSVLNWLFVIKKQSGCS